MEFVGKNGRSVRKVFFVFLAYLSHDMLQNLLPMCRSAVPTVALFRSLPVSWAQTWLYMFDMKSQLLQDGMSSSLWLALRLLLEKKSLDV